MDNTHITRNFFAHGGSELVIGGKLTFLPGAEVEGGSGLFGADGAARPVLPYIPDSTATSAAALRADYNALLAALRAAGFMADAPADEAGGAE